MSTIHLSAHARERLNNRTSLDESDFIKLVEKNSGVPIGKEPGTDKTHILFYSTLDRLWFIAVIDEKVHEVVTILPPDYHNRWRVSREAMLLAEKNTRAPEPKQPIGGTPPAPVTPPNPSRLIFQCTVSNGFRTWIRTFGFGLPYEQFSDCMEDISNSRRHQKIDNVITQALLDRKYAPEVICECVHIRLGKKGPEYKYPYESAPQ